MRILFAGSPGIAVPSLNALAALRPEEGIEPVAVLTNPDTPKGRRGDREPTEIGAAAEIINADRAARGLPLLTILKPEALKAEAREAVAACEPDLLVSFAYGRIFGPKFLSLFPLGGVNVHPSLLPKYRGATPIPAAILGRDRETGITVQRLAAEMDAGAILAQERLALDLSETTASLGERVSLLAPELLVGVLRGLAAGTLEGRPQDGGRATYCGTIAKDDGIIDWTSSAEELDARIRAYTPWPLCRTVHGEQDLYILEARPYGGGAGSEPVPAGTVTAVDKQAGILVQTGKGLLAVTRLQYGAKKALDWKSFLNGARNFIGSRLG